MCLLRAGIDNFLIHGGQSSVLARGVLAGSDRISDDDASSWRGIGGWSVGVADPLRPGKRLAEIILRDQALATSGSAKQFFRYKGRRYSHILDPRSGQPAQGVLSSTVIAPTAAAADALSTAAFRARAGSILGTSRQFSRMSVL